MEDSCITRLGSSHTRQVDVRILTATNRNLHEMMKRKLFRNDLFYRLSVIPLHVPPLRERHECLLPLIDLYLEQFSQQEKVSRRLTSTAIDALTNYLYPGNVRELMNICERLTVMSETEMIDVVDLPQTVITGSDQLVSNWPEIMTMAQIQESVERAVLLAASRRYHKQHDIATNLGMSQPTVARKLRKYGISSHFNNNN